MYASLGAGYRGRGGGFLALMVSPGGLETDLRRKTLKFVQLAGRGVAMMVAMTATDNVGAVWFMMDGGLQGGLRLRQVVVVGRARDDRIGGHCAAA
jgi:hypothetical protein